MKVKLKISATKTRIQTATKNFSIIPGAFGGKTEDTLYVFKQRVFGLKNVRVKGGRSYAFTQVFSVTDDEILLNKKGKNLITLFSCKNVLEQPISFIPKESIKKTC